jgi:uncharacterized protein YbbC (DUF1343 family)
VPVTFTPKSSKFANEQCHGVYVVIHDRRYVSPVNAGVTIAWHLERLFGDKFDLEAVGKMVHNDDALKAIRQANDPARVPAAWRQELDAFKRVREKYLLYQ